MKHGYVYILTNDYVPDLVKIGYTDRSPVERANELSRRTGVPGDWKVYKYWKLYDAHTWESRIFTELKGFRETGEFFRLKPTKAKDLISIFLKESGGLDSDGLSAADSAELEKAASRNREYEKKLKKKRIDKEWEKSSVKLHAQALDKAEKSFGKKTSVLIELINASKNEPLDFLYGIVMYPIFVAWYFLIMVPCLFLAIAGDPFKISSTLMGFSLPKTENEEVKKLRAELDKIYRLRDQLYQNDKVSFYHKALKNNHAADTKSVNSNTITDPFLKNYQANEKKRLERLAKIKAYDSSLIVSRSGSTDVKLHEFKSTQKINYFERETPSTKHFLPTFRKYKDENRQANPRLKQHKKPKVSGKGPNKKNVSDTFLENYQRDEKIRLEKIAKARSHGRFVQDASLNNDQIINKKKFSKKSNWKTFEDQVKSTKEVRDINDQTALHRAAIAGDAITILKLIHAGAHKTPKDKHGKTPWDYAKTNKKIMGTTAYYVLKSRDI